MDSIALAMDGITKWFPGTLAVDHVNFEVRVGEVHALIGENGAGKSTLMRVLTGSYNDYTGAIEVGGKTVDIHCPSDAKQHGIEMVYQELSLARPITIAENLLAGHLPTRRWGVLDKTAMVRKARHCLKSVGLDIDPLRTIEEISQHEAQLVEIAKALGNQPCVLILDEPTSALSRDEIQRLFAIVNDLKRCGLAVIYISHHLPEIFQVADRVTVMRDGRTVGTRSMNDVTPHDLVHMLVGQSIDAFYKQRAAVVGETVLRVDRLTRHGFFHDISLELRRGEILGLAGLSGAGRTELARSVCGLDPVDSGRVTLNTHVLRLGDYPAAVSAGLVYLSENRKDEGLFLRLSVTRNLLASRLSAFSRLGFCRPGAAGRSMVLQFIEELDIATASTETNAGKLSGGNQQKVLLAKCLAVEPEVLILDEPSRGVDLNAKRRIHKAVMDLADKGKSVLLISSDLPELVGLSDRAMVMRGGHIIGEMAKEELSEQAVLLAVNGHGVSCVV